MFAPKSCYALFSFPMRALLTACFLAGGLTVSAQTIINTPAEQQAPPQGAISAPQQQLGSPDSDDTGNKQLSPDGKRREKYAGLPAKFRDALEQQDLKRMKPGGKIVNKRPVPWLAPNGEQLVALVNNRFLTKPELAARAGLILRGQPKASDSNQAADQRVIAEEKIISDWVDITVLSLEAQANGITVTEQEIDAAMRQLAAENEKDTGETQQRLRAIGFPEEQLRQEVKDGILVEKFVKNYVNQRYNENELRRIYQANPGFFLPPAKAYVWQVVRPRVGMMGQDERQEAEKEMARWGKKLSKCDNDKDCEALKQELKKAQLKNEADGLAIQKLDWVNSNSPLSPTVMKAIFSIKKGDTSELISSDVGLHVIKVFDRQDGGKRVFAEARPMVEASLFEKTRDALVSGIRSKYSIRRAGSGLNKWVAVGSPESAGANAQASGEQPVNRESTALSPSGSAAEVDQLREGQASTGNSRAAKFSLPPPPPDELRVKAAPALNAGPRKRFSAPPPVSQVLAERAAEKKTDGGAPAASTPAAGGDPGATR